MKVKDNLKELLHKYYDERMCITQLIDFYEDKLNEHLDLKYIYSTWLVDSKNKLKELDIQIQYLQEELK